MPFVRRLVWEAWSVAHIARHQVSPEEVCHGDPVELESYANRIVLIGPTAAGRVLTAVLDPMVGAAYYPITARPASRRERRYFDQERGGARQ